MTSRKEFLLAGALAGAAPGIAVGATPAQKTAEKLPPLQFDRAAFEGVLNAPAQHRQCFTSTKLQWDVLQQMTNSLNAYQQYYKEALHPVAVLYHGPAVGIALSNDVWDHLLRPAIPALEKRGIKIESDLVAGKGNPFLTASATASDDDSSVERLVARGAHFFICNNVMTGMSGLIADVVKKSRATVYNQLLKGVVKGAMVVPAGVQAINAAQEAKFTLLQSTV